MKEKTKIILELEEDLKKYNKILLFLPSFENRLFQKFCGSDIYLAYEKELKIYALKANGVNSGDTIRVISEQDVKDILEVYYMYEFSNRLHVIGDNQQFGGLLNYLKTGILTEKEFFETIIS